MANSLFKIAEHTISVSFTEGQPNGVFLLPSYEPFAIKQNNGNESLLLSLHVDDNMLPFQADTISHIKESDTGNGVFSVYKHHDGRYQFIVKNNADEKCCLLQTSPDLRQCRCALFGNTTLRAFGLNSALMLAFAFASCRENTLLIHASLVRANGWGYAFTAKSGTGKSTHVNNWLSMIEGSDMMNDDNPIVRIINGTPYIFGSPWSGKTPCYRNTKAPLGAISQVIRHNTNHVSPATPIEAFTSLLVACSNMKWDKVVYDSICRTITKVIETTPYYNLYCLPDKESAVICHKTIARDKQ